MACCRRDVLTKLKHGVVKSELPADVAYVDATQYIALCGRDVKVFSTQNMRKAVCAGLVKRSARVSVVCTLAYSHLLAAGKTSTIVAVAITKLGTLQPRLQRPRRLQPRLLRIHRHDL